MSQISYQNEVLRDPSENLSCMNSPDNANIDEYALSKALIAHPVPCFRIQELEIRWHCSRSTVSRIREHYDLDRVAQNFCHPEFDLLEILAIEGIEDPAISWALGTDEDRKILLAPLLSIEELQLLDRTQTGYHRETYRRRARKNKRKAIQLGRRLLFRARSSELLRLEALKSND
jgi:hypothetical protein